MVQPTLSRDGQPVKLQDQPARMLAILVENAPRLVTREELRERLWAADTNVDFDTSLNTAVRKVRQVLGDSPDAPRFIETVPRKGYRFVAPVEFAAPPPANIAPPHSSPVEIQPVEAAAPARRWFWPIGAVIAIAVLLSAGLLMSRGRSVNPQGTVERYSFELPEGRPVYVGFGPSVAISANGRTIAFVVGADGQESEIYYRRINDAALHAIPGTKRASGIIVSADGESIAYRRDGQLTVSSLDGSSVKRIASVSTGIPETGFWGRDGMLYYSAPPEPEAPDFPTAIWRAPADGSRPPEQVTRQKLQRQEWHVPLWPLPDGRHILLYLVRSVEREVHMWDLLTGEDRLLVKAAGGHYLPTGHLLYHRQTRLYAAPFDVKRTEIIGPEAVVQPDVAVAGWSGGNMSFSDDGTLVYVRRTRDVPERTLSWVTLEGKERPLSIPPGDYELRDLSPDGKKVLVARYDPEEAAWTLWSMPLDGGAWVEVSSGHNPHVPAVWTPDGKGVVYSRPGTGLMRRQLDPLGTEETLIAESGYTYFPAPFAAKQREVVYMEGYHPRIKAVIGSIALERGAQRRNLLPGYSFPSISPDGRWLAAAKGRQANKPTDVFIFPYPPTPAATPIFVGSGTAPTWLPDGRGLIFRQNERFYRAAFQAGQVSAPELLLTGNFSASTLWFPNYLVSKDGRALLVSKESKGIPPPKSIHVVRNWFSEVRRLSPHPATP